MKNRFVFSPLITLLASLLFSPNAFSAETVVRVASYPKSRDADPSVVDIVIENGQNVAGYQVMVQFDSDFLEYQKMERGDYLPKNAFFGEEQIIDDIDPIDDSLKAIRFAATSFTGESNGYGILATLTFNRVKSGSSDLTLLIPGTLLSNKAGELSYPRLEHSKTYPKEFRDLVIGSIQARPTNSTKARSYYNKKETFTLQVTVRNRGNVDSHLRQLVYYGPTSKDTETGVELKTVDIGEAIQPNQELELPLFNIDAPEVSGTYYYTVSLVSINEDVTDNNNSKPLEIRVEELPDLVVELIKPDPLSLDPSKPDGLFFNLSFTLKNEGNGRANSPIYYRWHRSTHPKIHSMSLSEQEAAGASEEIGKIGKIEQFHPFGTELPANESTHIPLSLYAPEEPGTYYYHVCVESPHPEINPDNNCSDDVEITVEAPDLVAQNIWISMPFDSEERETITLGPGDKFFLNFRYKNEGPATEKTSVQFYQSPNKTISKTDTPLLADGQKLLSSNQTKHIWSGIDVPKNPGIYYYRAYVESVGGEINTDNNWSEVVTVTVRGKGLEIPEDLITDVAFTPNHTYFVLNPQFLSTTNSYLNTYLRHKCIITLHLGELYLDGTSDYYMLPLPSKVRTSIAGQLRDLGENISGTAFLHVVGKGAIGKLKVSEILKIGKMLFSFGDISDDSKADPKATITYYPNTDYGATIQGILDDIGNTPIENIPKDISDRIENSESGTKGDNLPILFMIQNKRLSNVGFEVAQDYYKPGDWVPIDITIPVPSVNVAPVLPSWVPGVIKNIVSFVDGIRIGAVKLVFETVEGLIEDIHKYLLVNDANSEPVILRYVGEEWNLEETFQMENPGIAAPSANLISLADYPPFQQLPPEIQAYLLQRFEGTANSTVINPELLQIPEQTTLLPNYPNPFNPETWIPYQLATPADVTLTIYDIQGRVVRDLDLGHQRAGMYHNRNRAAYWDGRNAVGEPVASGVYFYTLTAGDFTATRKLLVRK